MTPLTPATKKLLCLFVLLCFLSLGAYPASGDPGSPFAFSVMKSETAPLAGVKCYVFNGAGTYLGISGTTNDGGALTFNLSDGTFKFRVDYLGYQFWSPLYNVPAILSAEMSIPHQDVAITVQGVNQASQPVAGVRVYLFTASGAYQGLSRLTDSSGQVTFYLPEKAYKVRADYLGQQFWSEDFTGQDATVTIPMGDAEVTVAGAGVPLGGVKVYVFSAAGAYLGVSGTTDSSGKVPFTLPAGPYKFRADYQGSQYWRADAILTAGQVNPISISTGGGAFTLTVQKGIAGPLTGAKCYVFNGAGTYLGISGTTNDGGALTFNLSDGTYKFRVDYLGYQFWSDPCTVPMTLSAAMSIPHQDVVITVQGVNQGSVPLPGLNVYLFTAAGSYQGQYRVTDGNGQVSFNLPAQPYKVRVDYLGQQFWSEDFTGQDAAVNIPMGDAEVTVTSAGNPLGGVKVYVFSAADVYLGVSGTSDAGGRVFFALPAGSYKYRADYQGNQYWSDEGFLIAGQINAVAISTGGGSFNMTVMKNEMEPLVDVNCYVFNEGGSYLGISGISNGAGELSFDLSDGLYKFRVDYLGYQFWSQTYLVPATLSAIVTIPNQDTVIRLEAANQGAPVRLRG